MNCKSRFVDRYTRKVEEQELEELWRWCSIEYKDREAKARVLGVPARMRTFNYFYGLRFRILLQRHSDNLTASLQTKNLCAPEV